MAKRKPTPKKSATFKGLRNSKVLRYALTHKLITTASILVLLVVIGSTLFFTGAVKQIPLFSIGQTDTTTDTLAPVAQLDNNTDLLGQIGVSQEAIDNSNSITIASGKCKNTGMTVYYYDSNGHLSITTKNKDGSYTCTTYDVNTLKSYKTDDGSTITTETHTDTQTGSRQSVTKVQNTDGTTHTQIQTNNSDGSGYGAGGTFEERCFGANNTVCTQIDIGAGTYLDMVTTCLLVPIPDTSYYRIATPADGRLSLNYYNNSYPCSQAPNFHVVFYNK